MKNKYLFPRWCRSLGLILAVPGLILGYLYAVKGYEIPGFGFKMHKGNSLFQGEFENFTNELAIFLVVIGLTCTAFARNKKEDELSSKIRLNALYWSMAAYYSAYIICFFLQLIFGSIPFISEHTNELNIVMPLLIFNLRLYYLQYTGKDHFVISQPRFLPYRPFRLMGIIFTIAGTAGLIYALITENLFLSSEKWPTIVFAVFFSGLLFWAFSRHKTEDEMMIEQRMESLQIAFYFNYILFLIATLTVYSLNYLLVLIIGQFSLLVYFIIRMEYVRYRNQKITDTFEGGVES